MFIVSFILNLENEDISIDAALRVRMLQYEIHKLFPLYNNIFLWRLVKPVSTTKNWFAQKTVLTSLLWTCWSFVAASSVTVCDFSDLFIHSFILESYIAPLQDTNSVLPFEPNSCSRLRLVCFLLTVLADICGLRLWVLCLLFSPLP